VKRIFHLHIVARDGSIIDAWHFVPELLLAAAESGTSSRTKGKLPQEMDRRERQANPNLSTFSAAQIRRCHVRCCTSHAPASIPLSGLARRRVPGRNRAGEANGDQMRILFTGKVPQIRLAYSHTLSDECRDAVHPSRLTSGSLRSAWTGPSRDAGRISKMRAWQAVNEFA
jgi:hypothetical protein